MITDDLKGGEQFIPVDQSSEPHHFHPLCCSGLCRHRLIFYFMAKTVERLMAFQKSFLFAKTLLKKVSGSELGIQTLEDKLTRDS